MDLAAVWKNLGEIGGFQLHDLKELLFIDTEDMEEAAADTTLYTAPAVQALMTVHSGME